MFSLIPFQREDLARLALHPGAILGWDTGLGKTIAMFLWPLLKVGFLRPAIGHRQSAIGNRLIPAQPVLLVVPGDGHDQTDDESREHFHTVATRLDSQATFLRLSTLNPQLGTRHLPPGYYLTSYTQLSQNGVTPPPPETPKEFLRGIGETRTYLVTSPIRATGQGTCDTTAVPALPVTRHPSPVTSSVTLQIKCVYDPALVDHCQDCFGAVVVDEATKLQGDDTLIGLGCRQIRAPHRLPMTATPIKNRMPQLFHLAHFACGGGAAPTARFPYRPQDREAFTREFEVGETGASGRRKRTAQVSNIHRAWKIFPALILRRRKSDCGQDIVPMHRHVIRTPMGIHQAATYKYHLQALYLDKRERPALGARLQALRLAAANPTSPLLQPKSFPSTLTPHPSTSAFSPPHQSTTPSLQHSTQFRSSYDYIPKVATTLSLIEQVLRRGEQVLVGGAFESGLEALSSRLVAAGIPHLVLDGRTPPQQRGELARRFKRGCPRSQREGLTPGHSEFPVTLAGIESMAELHSFRFCNNVILTSYSWALDKMEQFVNRVHRINSPWPVNLWAVLCDGSADRVLEASHHEKRDAADLVLDARLLGTNAAEVNLAEVLEVAARDFAANQNYLDERDLEQDWPKLRAALAAAYQQWPVRRPRTVDLQLPTELVRLPTPPPTPLIGSPGLDPRPSALEPASDLPLWQAMLRPPGT